MASRFLKELQRLMNRRGWPPRLEVTPGAGQDDKGLAWDNTKKRFVFAAAGGGAGTMDHNALTSNLAWLTSGHTGTAGKVIGFDSGGEAEFLPWAMPDQHRRTEYWFASPGNKVSTNAVTNVTTAGTMTAAPDASGWFVEAKSKTSGDFKCSIVHASDNFTTTEGHPEFWVRIKTGPDVDAYRHWIIFTDGPGASHDADEPSRKYAGVRFSETDGETKWMIHARDGSNAATPVEINVTPAADTIYLIHCFVDQGAGTVTASVNGPSATLSGNLPPQTEKLGFANLLYAEGGGGDDRRTFLFSSARLTSA